MVKVRKLKDGRLSPSHTFDFFLQAPSAFQDLKNGKIVEVPEEVANQMRGIEVIENIGEDDGQEN